MPLVEEFCSGSISCKEEGGPVAERLAERTPDWFRAARESDKERWEAWLPYSWMEKSLSLSFWPF